MATHAWRFAERWTHNGETPFRFLINNVVSIWWGFKPSILWSEVKRETTKLQNWQWKSYCLLTLKCELLFQKTIQSCPSSFRLTICFLPIQFKDLQLSNFAWKPMSAVQICHRQLVLSTDCLKQQNTDHLSSNCFIGLHIVNMVK